MRKLIDRLFKSFCLIVSIVVGFIIFFPTATQAADTNFALPPYVVTTPAPNQSAPTVPLVSSMKFTQIKNFEVGGAAIDSLGYVWTWGYKYRGRTGLGKDFDYAGGMKRVPFFVDNNIKVAKIESSYDTVFATTTDGEVYAWGNNLYGQIGNGLSGHTNDAYTPQKVLFPDGEKIALLDASDDIGVAAVMAVSESGNVYGWGYSGGGELPFLKGNSNVPVKIDSLTSIGNDNGGIKKIVLGKGHAFILTNNNRLFCWGNGNAGALGLGNVKNVDEPTEIPFFADLNVKDVDIRGHHTMVMLDNNQVYEFGEVFGKGRVTATTTSTPIPLEYDFSSADYTPIPQKINSAVYNAYIVDQHGRIWVSGRNNYYMFLTDGPLAGGPTTRPYNYLDPSLGKLDMYLEKMTQLPKSLGDGDSQNDLNDIKGPVFSNVSKSNLTQSSLSFMHYEYQGMWGVLDSNYQLKHPTIYDKKYYKTVGDLLPFTSSGGAYVNTEKRRAAHKNVYMIDKDGNRLVYVVRQDSSTTYSGNFYIATSNYDGGWYVYNDKSAALPDGVTEKTSVPEVKDSEKAWIELATDGKPNDFTGTQHAELGYVADMQSYQSTTLILDTSGNLYKSGLDGSGAIAWGWDFNPVYDSSSSGDADNNGLYDTYVYELMYMRGAPRMITGNLDVSAPKEKHYASQKAEDTVDIKLSLGSAYQDTQLNITIEPVLNETKYIVMPYDKNDFNVTNKTPSKEEFDTAYSEASSLGYTAVDLAEKEGWKGYVQELNTPVKEFTDDSIKIDKNSVVWVMIQTTSYGATPTIVKAETYDNFYTDATINHQGLNKANSSQTIYTDNTENIQKITDDGIDNLIGFPLDKNGEIIGTPETPPTYGYDQATVSQLSTSQLEAVSTNLSKYWQFTNPQATSKTYTLDGVDADNSADITKTTGELAVTDRYTHNFYYDKDPTGFATVHYIGVDQSGETIAEFDIFDEEVQKGTDLTRTPQSLVDNDFIADKFLVLDGAPPSSYPIDISSAANLNSSGNATFNIPFDSNDHVVKTVVFVYRPPIKNGQLHIRQVVLNGQSPLSIPKQGYVMLNPGKVTTGNWTFESSVQNVFAKSQVALDSPDYNTYKVGLSNTVNGYQVSSIVPQYYQLVGYKVNNTTGVYDNNDIQSGKTIKLDYSNDSEYWLTIYIQPTTKSPDNFMWDTELNDFKTIKVGS